MRHRIPTAGLLVAASIAGLIIGQSSFTPAAPAQGAEKQAGGIPTFELDRSWPKVPDKWKLGDASSVAVDEQDHVWVLHRPRTLPADQIAKAAPPVLEFDPAGNFVQAWGGSGEGYEWPEREHGIFVDSKGDVWIGGNNCPARNLPGLKPVSDDQILKFTKAGKFVIQLGHSSKSGGNADTKNFHEPADVWVYPKTNEAFIADGYGNHRLIVLDGDTGAFKRMWGAFGNQPADNDVCPSSDTPIAKHQPEPGPGPQQFDIVHTVRVSNDGLVYVGDRENKRVQVFTLDGKYMNQVVRRSGPGFAGGLAFSADPQQEFLYVMGNADISVLNRKTLEVLGTFGGDSKDGGGHHIASDSKGNIYVARTNRGLRKWVFKGLSPAPKP